MANLVLLISIVAITFHYMQANRDIETQKSAFASLQIASGSSQEINVNVGWAFASGDRVVLRSGGFEDVEYVVP